MKRNKRGLVLLQVMILGIIIAFLAAGMAAMLLTRKYSSSRLEEANQGNRNDGGGLNQLLYSWSLPENNSQTGGVCSKNVPNGWTYVEGGDSCAECKLDNGTITVEAKSSQKNGTWPNCGQSSLSVNY